MARWDSGGGAPSVNPHEGQLMMMQSRISKMEGQLQSAIGIVQSLPAQREYRQLQQDIAMGKEHIGALCARVAALEKGMKECQEREAEANARLEASAASFAELVAVVQEMASVLVKMEVVV